MADDAGWVLVTSGQVHGCGIRLDGSLSCWGDNTSGQLGVNTTAASFQQTEVPDGPWLTVTSGGSQTCAIKQDSTLWCWGGNTSGQLGTGNTKPSSVPVQVTNTGWAQVSDNYYHTCAIKQDGTLWCWGSNADSQLALDPTVSYRPAPSQIVGSTWEQVTTGADHTCAIKQDGTLWCWGGNSTGQLGNQTVPAALHSKSSGLLSIVGVWTEVSAGQKHTCAIASDKALWCWGDNSQGQLGTGNTTQAIVPAAISSTGLTWEHVAAGLTHTCALATGGTLWCWGSNSDGQLGIGRGETRQVPTQVVQ
jgi:alpha-tubulin suppressor-like RCC1 family protein